MDTFTKDPNAVKDFAVDWTEWLNGDAIETSTWILPAGLTEDDSSESAGITTIFISGGTDGTSYVVTNRVVTEGGRTEDHSITIQVRESSTPEEAASDDELLAAIDAEIAANPGGVTHYRTRDGREVTRMNLNQLLKAKATIAASEFRRTEGMFAGVRFRRPE